MVFGPRHIGCLLQLLVLVSCLWLTSADYACICSRAVDSPLYIAPDQTAHIIGYLYEFDCKPQYTGSLGLAGSWNAVFIDHQIAYIQMTPSLLTETCHGDLPDEDKLTTVPIVRPSTTIRPSTAASSTARTSTVSPTTVSSTSTMPTAFTTYATAKECPSNVRQAARSNHGNTSVYGNTCYELVPYRYSWQYAENNCKNKGGHLVHIRDMVEENNVLQFLSDNNYEHHIWIGLSDSDSELNFRWSSGDPVTFTKWKPGYDLHHTLHRVTDCVLLAPSFNRYSIYGDWDDTACISEHPWVCQYEAVAARSTHTTQSTTSTSGSYNHYYHHHGSSSSNQNNNYNNNQNESNYNQNSHGHSGSDYNQHGYNYNTYTTTKAIDERIKDYLLDLIG